MTTLEDITMLMKSATAEELVLATRAYHFAEHAHRDHRRYSGEPYFIHLVETAKNLAELGMNATTIAAGLLHDAIEDVGVTPETIRKEFGEEVLMLVEGVTKLGHLRYRGIDRYSESMRRLFIASAKDVRVLIIKLADRLHNMRTLSHVPAHKQHRIASETLEIYAPIAYRLGIRKVSRELEELAFPFVYPQEYERVKKLFKEKSPELVKKLEKFHKSILKSFSREGIRDFYTTHRIKSLYSLFIKLKNKEWDFEKIFDLLAIRIVVKNIEECYRVLGVIHGSWRPLPGRIKDYIAFPKPNGYRSVHTTVFTGDGGTVEIQIRTEEMDRESEYGVAMYVEYKRREKKGKREKRSSKFPQRDLVHSLVNWKKKNPASDSEDTAVIDEEEGTPAWVRELGEHASIEDPEFLTEIKGDFFKNRVFIFTPKGDVVDLPIDSTPLDFAYAIHSDIGDHLVGAKVNGKLAAIDTALKNGDIVEILTKTNAHPSQKWLGIARTTIARKHIRTALVKLKLD